MARRVETWLAQVWRVPARQGSQGWACRVRGEARSGEARQPRHERVMFESWFGKAVESRPALVSRDVASYGLARQSRRAEDVTAW
jgi:hypothetical protein